MFRRLQPCEQPRYRHEIFRGRPRRRPPSTPRVRLTLRCRLRRSAVLSEIVNAGPAPKPTHILPPPARAASRLEATLKISRRYVVGAGSGGRLRVDIGDGKRTAELNVPITWPSLGKGPARLFRSLRTETGAARRRVEISTRNLRGTSAPPAAVDATQPIDAAVSAPALSPFRARS